MGTGRGWESRDGNKCVGKDGRVLYTWPACTVSVRCYLRVGLTPDTTAPPHSRPTGSRIEGWPWERSLRCLRNVHFFLFSSLAAQPYAAKFQLRPIGHIGPPWPDISLPSSPRPTIFHTNMQNDTLPPRHSSNRYCYGRPPPATLHGRAFISTTH